MTAPFRERPKLRLLQPAVVRHQGQELIHISDPLGFSDRQIVVTPDVFFIMALCDGTRSLIDIQYEYTRRFGTLLLPSHLDKILSDLDRSLFLENERFQRRKAEIEDEFRKASVRKPSHAGQAYPADPVELRQCLGNFFTSPEGPGAFPEKRRRKSVKAIMAPHIDLRAGGPCFAWAYTQLVSSSPADIYVILGIGHAPMDNLFTVTSKDFETPLGVLPTDKGFLDALVESHPSDLFADEFAHRSEHSVEFQTVFLRYIFPDQDISIVPILCSSFDEMIAANCEPIEDPRIGSFVHALKIAARRSKRKVCYVAGVDLAHVGQKFGDSERLTPSTAVVLEQDDREMLRHVENVDAAAFFASIAKDRNKRKICGFPAVYVLLNLVEGAKGRLLNYGKSGDPATQSIVSFASMVFE